MGAFEFVITVVVLIGVFTLTAMKIQSRDKARYGAEDTELIQELHKGFERLGQRVETLETILIDKAGGATATNDAEEPADSVLSEGGHD